MAHPARQTTAGQLQEAEFYARLNSKHLPVREKFPVILYSDPYRTWAIFRNSTGDKKIKNEQTEKKKKKVNKYGSRISFSVSVGRWW